jgi:hypothetical protein
MNLEFTEEDLLAIGEALDHAAKRTADELKLARARPYTRALQAEQKRYESLLARIVGAVNGNAAA